MNTSRTDDAIAILGTGVLFPEATSPAQLWANLLANHCAITQVNTGDLGADPSLFYNATKGKLDTCYSLRGGFIRNFLFDPQGYKLDAQTLLRQDQQLQWCLYVAREALLDSGYWQHPQLKRCGVVMGNLSFPTRQSQQTLGAVYAAMAQQTLETVTGQSIVVPTPVTGQSVPLGESLLISPPSAFVAQALGLKGPHYSLDAACASSLYAIKLACDELRAGKADLMLAGAVSGSSPLLIHVGFSYFHAYAQHDERSAPLDRQSAGLTSAEGAGIVVLKRLADAQRDGDTIQAVIDGIGLSNDGKGEFLLTPNSKGQRLAFERAYHQTSFGPDGIDYVECHATGTQLGDRTELNSISDFFGAKVPLLGSVKSNLGHLLTAAGMASLSKMLLALHHRVLPATIGIQEPLASADGQVGNQQLVRANQTWPGNHEIRRAGINAFGFGGTNAHLVLSSPAPNPLPSEPPASYKAAPMAIVGMDIHVGDCSTLDDYYLSLLLGRQHFRPLPPERWKGLDALRQTLDTVGFPALETVRGAWVEAFEIDLLRFKIPPKEAERATLQQILMLDVADKAIQNAGLDKRVGQGANVAVIIAMETELETHHRLGRWHMDWQVRQAVRDAGLSVDEAPLTALVDDLKNAIFSDYEEHTLGEHTGFIGNIIASRIAALMDFTGPAFTVSSNENGVYKALGIAQTLLTNREVDAVVLGAVDLGGGFESVLSRHAAQPIHTGPVSMGWDHRTTGWTIGEGAAAIVLQRADDCTNERVYARIDDLAIVQSDVISWQGTVSANAVAEAASHVLNRQQLSPADIGYLEASASGNTAVNEAEIAGLTRVYRVNSDKQLTCALGSSKAHVGHTVSASGMVSLITAALTLYHRLLPGVPHWEGPESAEAFAESAFYVPTFSRPWLGKKEMAAREASILRAAVSGLATDGTAAHVLLSEGSHPQPGDASVYLQRGGERLLPLRAPTLDDLLNRLDALDQQLATQSLTTVSDACCTNFDADSTGSQTLAIVASSSEEARREVRFFQTKLFQSGGAETIQTPSGSQYAAAPLGHTAKLALVYPGSGSAYIGAGATLLQAFPALYDRLYEQGYDPTDALNDELYPRTLFAWRPAEKDEREKQLQTNALTMMLIGCTFSGLYTKIIQESLGVKADAVLGYSMGETSAMWYSQNIWSTAAVKTDFIQAPLFRELVGGRMRLLADLWQLPEAEARQRWQSRLIHLPVGVPGFATLADWFWQVVAPVEPRVYLTFINTDTEIILSGDASDLDRVLTQYGLKAVPLTINNVVHHDFCRRVSTDILHMHRLAIQQAPDKAYYSSITGTPLVVNSDTLAHNALEVCCRPVDWPHIVRQLVADNHRLFIEVGPNATCSRWIDAILKGQPHATLATDRKGSSALRSLTGLVAKLIAHGVPVNLSPFYQKSDLSAPPRRTLMKRLRTGGPRLESLLLISEKRQSFLQTLTRTNAMLAESIPMLSANSSQLTIVPVAERPVVVPTVVESKTQSVAENGLCLQDYTHPDYLKNKHIIWDESDLLTFATGRIGGVFGPDYAPIDTYRRRVMLPMPPYLLVSRVTKLDATLHQFKPSSLTTEYDIPYGSAFATDGQIPWAVAVESGQCDLLLISYLGIDFQNQGDYVYRLLDCTLTFTDDLPFEGQTLRYDIAIDRFVRNGNNLLFFFHYRCYVADRLVLKMDGGCAGFFSDEELAQGQGVVFSPQELAQRAARLRQSFVPLLNCAKTSFSTDDLLALVEGDLPACFGADYQPNGRNPSLRLPPKSILMLDRITRVDRCGGSVGLGFIEAEKDLHPDDWYFPCHFRDDQVLAGSLQAEGGGQLLRFYMLLLGMQRLTKDARFQPVLDVPQKVRCRKEVPPKAGKLIYQMDVREIGLVPEPYVIADLSILYDGQVAVFFENLGLRLQEKSQPTYRKKTETRQEGIYVKPVDKPLLLNEFNITQLALGTIDKCFGESYKVYEGRAFSRQPNTDLQLISRIVSSTGEPMVFSNKPVLVTEYDVPADAWYYAQNAAPQMPYSILMEIALQPCGFLGAYLGTPLIFKDRDLFLRNLDGDGELLRSVDLRDQTLTNRVCLLSHTALNGTILQRYSYELSVGGEPFYRGSASFGCFTKEELSNQVGLDRGVHVAPWYKTQSDDQQGHLSFKLDSLFGRLKLYRSTNPAAPQLHLAMDQLDLLDTVRIVPKGGLYGQGYVFAQKVVQPHNWFFTCHFYTDPVMPGSLGVEAMLQAMQVFVLQQGLADGLTNVSFRQATPHKTVWKYRGQILATDPDMRLEIHVKAIERTAESVQLVADASLWKGPLRIYAVSDLSLLVS